MVDLSDKKESDGRCSCICKLLKWDKIDLFEIQKIISHTCDQIQCQGHTSKYQLQLCHLASSTSTHCPILYTLQIIYVVICCILMGFDGHIYHLYDIHRYFICFQADVGPEKFSQIHMLANRYSTMTSNIVEFVNTITKAAKNYLFVSLLKLLRQTIYSQFFKHEMMCI